MVEPMGLLGGLSVGEFAIQAFRTSPISLKYNQLIIIIIA